jgi:hypothetical protein
MTEEMKENRRRKKQAEEFKERMMRREGDWQLEAAWVTEEAAKVLVEMFQKEMENGTFIPIEPWEEFVYKQFRTQMKRQRRTGGVFCPKCKNPSDS